MKRLLAVLLICLVNATYAQLHTDLSRVDWNVQSIDAPTPDSLARKLTAPYNSDLEKVRAIFRWITNNIYYNVGYFSSHFAAAKKYASDGYDTIANWKPANEIMAEQVLRRRLAVCDGYTKLFKTLCDYAGIRSEIIVGYARGERNRISSRFACNHSWNAVYIDSSWHLLDVTWASGFVTYSNEFIQQFDEAYFFPSPEQFIQDHYPNDPRWTLLDHPPVMEEYRLTPFKCKSFIKYGVRSFSPSAGIIDARVGDTVHITLQLNTDNKNIAPDPFMDSTIFSDTAFSVFVKPDTITHGKAEYKWVVGRDSIEWINLVYNDDFIMRYRLKLKKAGDN